MRYSGLRAEELGEVEGRAGTRGGVVAHMLVGCWVAGTGIRNLG